MTRVLASPEGAEMYRQLKNARVAEQFPDSIRKFKQYVAAHVARNEVGYEAAAKAIATADPSLYARARLAGMQQIDGMPCWLTQMGLDRFGIVMTAVWRAACDRTGLGNAFKAARPSCGVAAYYAHDAKPGGSDQKHDAVATDIQITASTRSHGRGLLQSCSDRTTFRLFSNPYFHKN
jgi:hypothetical protein